MNNGPLYLEARSELFDHFINTKTLSSGRGGVSQTYHMTEILLANSVKSKILKINHIFAIFMKYSVAFNFGFRPVVFKGRREIHLKSLSIPYAVFLTLHCERGVCMTIA